MRTLITCIFFCLALGGLTTKGLVHAKPNEFAAPEIVLNLKPPIVSGATVKLPYEIFYPGYIEFYLFDANMVKIWQDFGVREKGAHAQALRADKLEKGKVYHFEFWYKGKPYPGKFTA
jgi:hypothetical protein